MDLINEHDSARVVFQLLDHCFDALLKITAIPGTCKQGSHIKREDCGISQNCRHIPVDNFTREAFSDRGFTNPRIAHK